MCIGMCIVLFIELKFYLYINTLIQFIDSYYQHHFNQNVTENTPLKPLWDDFPLASPP